MTDAHDREIAGPSRGSTPFYLERILPATAMLREAGFGRVTYEQVTFGIAAIHIAEV